VEAFYRHVDPIRKAGAAVVITDNVVKSREARGSWAIGSERKKSRADVHLGMQALELFGRDRTGRSRITVHKDRPGHLVRPVAGVFVLSSEAGSCTWRIDPDESFDAEGEFRPTHMMQKVSRYLEQCLEAAPSRTQIETVVGGKAATVRLAIDRLILEGYAVEVAGPRRGRLVQIRKPFVDGGDE
jgi:hypothetical protein